MKFNNKNLFYCFINILKYFIFRSYSYYIEVSMDQKDWVRVIDHTRYYCRSWQFLYFKERVVRYIRIVGTNNTVNKVFHVVNFEAMYTNNMPAIQDGLIGIKKIKILCKMKILSMDWEKFFFILFF